VTEPADQLRTHHNSLLAQAHRLTRDRHTSEDLVQETYLHALRGWHTFDGRNLRGWLGRILFNAFATEHRKRTPIPIGDTRYAQQNPPSSPGADIEHLARTIDPTIVRAFHTLTREQQHVVYQVDVRGQRPVDVARASGTNATTVNVRLHRARQQLRTMLEETREPA
jgi:RNA polymerase sigma-70 factor (ECF subfamily)